MLQPTFCVWYFQHPASVYSSFKTPLKVHLLRKSFPPHLTQVEMTTSSLTGVTTAPFILWKQQDLIRLLLSLQLLMDIECPLGFQTFGVPEPKCRQKHMGEAEGVYGETMYIQEQKAARAMRKFKGSGSNTVQTAVNFYIPGFGVIHTTGAFSVYALFVTWQPWWQRASSLCANCSFNMLMLTSFTVLLPCLTTVG